MSPKFSKWLAVAVTVTLLALPFAAGAEDLPWKSGGGASRMNVGADDAYRAPGDGNGSDAYQPDGSSANDGSEPPYESEYVPENGTRDAARGDGPGEPYSPPPMDYNEAQRGRPGASDPRHDQGYEQGEIIGAGHHFFGGITSGLANAVEYAFKSQGRPNGYILGEDAGGALIVGLRYGEGTLYTKDAGTHKVFWQGPSLGYDAGAEGSKTLVLVYNMREPSEIYERFGGVQGSAYLIGGVSIQFQKYNDVTLAVIRSGLGLRLGASIGYLKYTREPTWNPL